MARAQYSMEFMLVFAFSLMVVMPLILILQSEYNQNKEILNVAQARQVLDQISITAQKTYYSGAPSRNTLEVVFPSGVQLINATNIGGTAKKAELLMSVSRGMDQDVITDIVPFWVEFDISTSSGTRKILIKAEDSGIVNITDLT